MFYFFGIQPVMLGLVRVARHDITRLQALKYPSYPVVFRNNLWRVLSGGLALLRLRRPVPLVMRKAMWACDLSGFGDREEGYGVCRPSLK